MTSPRYVLGIDVGTGSVRAGVFDERGTRAGMAVAPIQLFRPAPDFVEQSSDDIWNAAGQAVRGALAQAGLRGDQVVGLGFDATCSLVVLDASNRPVSVSPGGNDAQNVIVWMDHRAIAQAERINAGNHNVLRYVGSVISPEMQTPKLLWLKEHAPQSFARASRFLDLPDFLSYRATGRDTRSLCTTVCKWTYLGQEQRWDADYFRAIGLGILADEQFQRIGTEVRALGESVGSLTPTAADELGLAAGIPVSVSIIDAHAGALGLLGVPLAGSAAPDFNTRLALIGGTSSCHMAVSSEPRFIDGIWGPYYSALVPGSFLTEGGQSATGALLDHVVNNHARSPELRARADAKGVSVYALLNDVVASMARALPFPALLTRELHVYPDFHGNRSPRADPRLRGMVSGLSLDDSTESLALLYLATLQAIAQGTRHIVDSMNACGYRIDTLVACGGDTKNALFVREHADVTGCRIVMPREPEAVLLGASMLGAVAAGLAKDLPSAMAAMSGPGAVIEPGESEVRDYHAKKHHVFMRMHGDQLEYRELMHTDD